MQKNAIIFGDSYSTFDKYVPDGYACYYPENEHPKYVPDGYGSYYLESEHPETDVTKVSQTWWHQVVTEANLNLVLNDSWSGSTIGYTGYDNADCSRSSSFLYRFNRLVEQNFFNENTVDTVFVFGGTNDSWSNAPLGTIKYDNFTNDDLYSVLPAISYFLKSLKETLPKADIYCLVNTKLKPEIVDGFDKACKKYNITKITFDEIDKRNDHPTIKGMQDIKNQVLKIINSNKKAE